MKGYILLVTTVLSIFFGVVMPGTTQDKNMQSLEALAEGSNKFAVALYQHLSKTSEGNLIVCPISLQVILALVYSGTGGQTAREIKEVLGLPENLDDVLKGHKLLIEELRNPVLKLANRMFLDDSFTVKPEFQEATTNYFFSTVKNLNFSADPQASRLHINKWVEDNTNEKIKDLLMEGTIDAATRAVLINAIHFKANWLYKFDPEDTEEEQFWVTPTQSVPVQMMSIKKKFGFKHHAELGAKILELPYQGNEFRMIVILPDAKDGLASVEEKLPTLNLAAEFANLYPSTVNVQLPRFKMENSMELKEVLSALGIRSMFSSQANFSGMSDEPLVVSHVIQKAFIEVNEEGTEAAAATAVVMLRMCARVQENLYFKADHPFIVLLLKKKDMGVLFIGKFVEPI